MPATVVAERPPSLQPRLAALLAAADGAAVRWCVLRGTGELAAPGGEADLLVHRADRARLTRALATAGAAALTAPGRGTHRFHLAYNPAHDAWLRLDVVTELQFGPAQELRTSTAAAVLARRRRHGPIAVPAPEDAFWALLLHELLDRPALREAGRARGELAALSRAATGDSPLRAIVDAACPPRWSAERVRRVAATGDLHALEALREPLIAGWPGSPAGRRALAGRARVLRRLHRWSPVTGTPGVILAVTGGDGASRAAAAAAIAAAWPAPARVVHAGGARGAAAARIVRGSGRLAVLERDGMAGVGADAVLDLATAGDPDAARRSAIDRAWRRAAARRGHSTEAITSYSLSSSTG